MQLVTDMKLPFVPFDTPEFAIDPMPAIEAARRQHPWLAKCSVGYFIHEYDAMKELYLMDDKLRISTDSVVEIMGATGSPWGNFMIRSMITKAGPEHARLRASVAAAFTPRNINRLRGLIRDVISDLLDEWVPKRSFDFADFSSNFPITVMFGFMGVSTDALAGIRKALEAQGLSYSMDPSLLPAMEDAYQVLWKFVSDVVAERRKQGTRNEGELLDEMIVAHDSGQLNEVEMLELLIFLFAAAYDTSKNMTTLIMHTMLQHPYMWERCAEDKAYCVKVVEEMLRHTSVSNVPRTVKDEVVYRDVVFPKDSFLILALTLSGRDPGAFPNAMDFQPERPHVNRHIAFGRGMHMCLGQHLAKAQMEEGIHLIAQRLIKPKLAGEVTWRRFPGVWGVQSLPISFEPGARRPVH
jgi:cytochrome P450